MEFDQFVEFSSAVIRQLPCNLDQVSAQRWIRDQGALAKALRKALWPVWELYLAPAQQNGGTIKGFDLDKHLEETKLIDRCLLLEDETVKEWLVHPSSYPEEFKGKVVFLWKSQRSSGDGRDVVCLIWRGDHVVVSWAWLESRWSGDSPVLLASS